jgi:hypothetical protein
MEPTSLKLRITAFLKKIIRVRNYLLKEHKCFRGEEETAALIKHFKDWMRRCNTSRAMAEMFLYRQEDIMFLLPGKASKSHEKIMAEFEELVNASLKIVSQTKPVETFV